MIPSDCLFAAVWFVVFVWCCCVFFVQSYVGGCRLGLGLKLVRVVWLSSIWTHVCVQMSFREIGCVDVPCLILWFFQVC